MQRMNFLNRTVCVFLMAAILLGALSLPVLADSDGDDANVDFTRADSLYDVAVSPSEVLRALWGDTVSDAEAAYADTYFDNVLLYSADVSAEHVSVTTNGDTVSVSANEYSFTATNGAPVTWTPVSAAYGEQSKDMQKDGDEYVCEFSLCSEASLTVTYKATLSLPGAFVTELSNFAYSDKQKADVIRSAHEQALKSYLDAYAKYQTYLDAMDKYCSDMDKYEEYLGQKAIYEERLAEYNSYLSLLAKYESDLAAFEKYLADYEKYLADKKLYDDAYNANAALYDEYKVYLANLSDIRASMAALDSIYVTPENGVGNLFGALQNAEIIGMIEEYQELLISIYGVKRSDVVDMRSTSDELTQMLIDYKKAKDTSEQAAFEYYKENYEDISEKFNYLYEKMTAVLKKNIFIHVCTLFENKYNHDPDLAKYKKWRVRNVLCHIYLICYALDDTQTLGTKWEFYQDNGELFSYDFSDLLAQNVIITDTNSASPASLEWIDGSRFGSSMLTPPTVPKEVKQPTPPREVSKPTEPQKVSKPTAPDTVAEPQVPKIEDYDLVLRTEQYFEETTLTPREVPERSELTFFQEVTRPFSSDNTPLTAYFNYDGSLLSTEAEPQTPTRADTPSHTYTFRSWQERTHGGDTLLYALYDSQKRVYNISFRYSDDGDDIFSCQCAYGELPVFGGETPSKTPSQTAVYSFAGWYPQLLPVTKDTVYLAQFFESTRYYKVSWKILDSVQSRELPFGAQVTPPQIKQKQYIGGSLYEFTGWDSVPSAVTEDKTYQARFNVSVLSTLPEQSDGELNIYHNGEAYVLSADGTSAHIAGLLGKAKEDGSGLVINMRGMTLRLDSGSVSDLAERGAENFSVLEQDEGIGYTFTNEAGYNVRFHGKALMSLSNRLGSAENLYVVCTSRGGAVSEKSCSATADLAEFVAQPQDLHRLERYYSVTVTTPDGGNVALYTGKTLFRAGAAVLFDIKPDPEYMLCALTFVDQNGNVTDFFKDKYFYMPKSDVTVHAEFKQKTYTVTFISNGTVISAKEYLFGDKLEIPDIPLSFEKDGYTYTFVGWSVPLTESSVVTDNAVYTAKYSAELTELKQTPNEQSATDKVLKDQLLPAIAIAVTLAAAITVTAIFLKKRKKTKK